MAVCCSIYGLGFHLNVPLEALLGLPPAKKIDVFINIESHPIVGCLADNLSAEEFYVSSHCDGEGVPEFRAYRLHGCGGLRIAYSYGAVFDIDGDGGRMSVYVPQEMEANDVAPSLLGPMLGVLLRLRGIVCLHASAVVIDGQAIGLVGASGAGKSTTAAAFARLGLPILSDDVLALTDYVDCFFARPAYPRIRLWSQSAAGLFGSSDALPRMIPGWDKRFLSLQQSGYRFQEQPLPLGALYFLAPRSPQNRIAIVEAINPAEALMAMLSDSFATNFQDRSKRAAEFELLSRLVRAVPLRRVTAPDGFERIDDLCHAIIQDLRSLRATAEDVKPERICH